MSRHRSGPLNHTKMLYFLRQFTDNEFLKQLAAQTRLQNMGMADGLQLMGKWTTGCAHRCINALTSSSSFCVAHCRSFADDPTGQPRRRKRSNSNLYQDNFQDVYGQDARRVRSNSASSGGMLAGQMHPQIGLLGGPADGSAGPISDSLLDDQHMQAYHLVHHQLDREAQDPQAAWLWTVMNSPQVQASGQTVSSVHDAVINMTCVLKHFAYMLLELVNCDTHTAGAAGDRGAEAWPRKPAPTEHAVFADPESGLRRSANRCSG